MSPCRRFFRREGWETMSTDEQASESLIDATRHWGGDGLDLQRCRNPDSRPLALPLLARSRSRSAFLLIAFSTASWRWSSNHSVVRGNGFSSSGSTGGMSSVGSFGFSMGSRLARLGLSEHWISARSSPILGPDSSPAPYSSIRSALARSDARIVSLEDQLRCT